MTVGHQAYHVVPQPGVEMLSSQRLLIVESEFLIALDIQRIIEDSNAAQIVMARSFAEAAELEHRFAEFDLAIINAPETEDLPIIEKLMAAGPAVIVSTAAAADLSATPLAGATLLLKPFSDEQLLAACNQALLEKSA